MTGTMLAATVFDIAAVLLLIFGFLNEKKIIAFEDRLIYTAARMWKRYLRRRYIKKQARRHAHLRLVAPVRHQSCNRTA